MTTALTSPFLGSAPAEVHLSRSPLVRVVIQAKFSSVLKIDSREGIAQFQEEIRAEYPLLEQVGVPQLQFDPATNTPSFRQTNVWKFSNASRTNVVSLASDVVTLEVRTYSGRAKFLEQWMNILTLLNSSFAPGLVVRTGVRYLNRLESESLNELSTLVSNNFIGVAEPRFLNDVSQAISEANIRVSEGDILLRWGMLPPKATIDPNLLEPVDAASWILDIDVFSNSQKIFDMSKLSDEYRRLTERAYTVFRWVMLDSGLEHFGAKI